ncbi:hypothetical protein [Streptomyces sp. RTd22]|uniref:hypothetical protein n=1 Tax=Streptomyces sp. RTd22 TaxID=1841249 RepID=UPI00131AE6B7|nr:hypothetical protein [Streptomyces sp. RTd22]
MSGIIFVMDAGVAAVLGAAVGTVGTIATGWTSRSLAKMQMRVESLRERREPRRSSYEAFSSAAVALHDHLQPWIKFGRLLDRARAGDTDGANSTSSVSSENFREAYIPRAIELADEVGTCGRAVILNGPAELEPLVTKIMDLSGVLVAVFRIMHSFMHIADDGRSIVAYDTSKLPDELKQLEQEVRQFLLHASASLDHDAVTRHTSGVLRRPSKS